MVEKEVLQSRELPLAADFAALKIKEPGTISIDHSSTVSGEGSIMPETPTSLAVKIQPTAVMHPLN